MQANTTTIPPHERWIWIELIGFDKDLPDAGVANYLDTLGFTPHAISLLITAADFIHHHEGMEREVVLPPDACSYFGHPQNAERKRQEWTNHDVRRLVRALRSHGVKAFFATFVVYLSNQFHQEWVHDHLELLEKRRDGEMNVAFQPLKRFRDGRYYEDFVIPKLVQTLQDYEFDGWHAADGWGPARLPLSECDYSDDMFDQFVQWSGLELPPHIMRRCEDQAERFSERAAWVWNNQRRLWIDFYVERWTRFYEKKVAALHAIGKEVVINSAWTRDPFEAIHRFGIDYRRLVETGLDGIVTESAAGASDMEAEVGSKVYLYNYTASLLMIKAFAPRAKLVFLHGIKDTKEQWDLIHHAPTVLESETYSLTNIYLRNGNGHFQRCSDGFVICLGDAIAKPEWQWLEKRWKLAFGKLPRDLMSATLVWSDAALSAELDDFIANRNIISHRLLTYLMEQGAPVQAAVRIEDIDHATGCLLLLNSHNLNPGELDRVFSYRNGPIILIGRKTVELPAPDLEFSAGMPADDLYCRAWRLVTAMHHEFAAGRASDQHGMEVIDKANITEPLSFVQYLPMQEPSLNFINDCARLLTIASGPVRLVEPDEMVNVQTTVGDDGKLRVLVRNRRLAYATPTLDMGAPVRSLKVLTEFPCTELVPDGSRFSVKIPGRGATVVEVELEKSA